MFVLAARVAKGRSESSEREEEGEVREKINKDLFRLCCDALCRVFRSLRLTVETDDDDDD